VALSDYSSLSCRLCSRCIRSFWSYPMSCRCYAVYAEGVIRKLCSCHRRRLLLVVCKFSRCGSYILHVLPSQPSAAHVLATPLRNVCTAFVGRYDEQDATCMLQPSMCACCPTHHPVLNCSCSWRRQHRRQLPQQQQCGGQPTIHYAAASAVELPTQPAAAAAHGSVC
jgi:hypothetical protein